MYRSALSTYYALSLFVVGTTVFTMHPSHDTRFTSWQQGIRGQLATAWIQVIGDDSWFEDVELLFDSIDSFYKQSSDAVIVMFGSPAADADIYYVIHEVYDQFAKSIKLENSSGISYNYEDVELPPLPVNFMQEEPLYNLVPYKTIVKTISDGTVAGANKSVDEPVNTKAMPWVTVKDNMTGQLYCLALYNGEVNKYLGKCQNDYH